MIVVVSTPSVPVDDNGVALAVATPSASNQFGVSLTGVDGSTWDLLNGPVRLLTGVQAFAAPTVAHQWQVSPLGDGSRHGGMRTPQSDGVILPLGVLADDWQTWVETDGALFRALHPSGEALFTVTRPDGKARTQGLRFVAGGGVEESDPLTQLFAAYALEFTAANPFWQGDPVLYTFDFADPLPLFPGPPFNINRSSADSTSSMTNPGDEPAYPRYTILGPALSWTVGVGDALISSDTELLAGQSITIDTDRSKLTVVDETGMNVYGDLDNDDFAAIPAGVDVPVTVSIDGFSDASQVRVEFTPLYRRPW